MPLMLATDNTVIRGSSNQSWRWPSPKTYCNEPSPTISRPRPIASTGTARGSLGFFSRVSMTIPAKMPGTTLMKNTQFHEKLSVSQPPNVGPTAGPTIAPIEKSPWLRPTLSLGNVSRSVACAVAINPPPNAP